MTDEYVAPEETPAEPVIPLDIAEALAAIQAEEEAEIAAHAVAVQAESDRIEKMRAAKAVCVAECGPVAEVLARTTNERERKVLMDLEERKHASHADALAAAYLEFSGQRAEDSNPATVGETTQLTADIAVDAAAST